MCFIIFFVSHCVVCRGRIGMSDTMTIKQWLAWLALPMISRVQTIRLSWPATASEQPSGSVVTTAGQLKIKISIRNICKQGLHNTFLRKAFDFQNLSETSKTCSIRKYWSKFISLNNSFVKRQWHYIKSNAFIHSVVETKIQGALSQN